jgi:hypothetical protein
MPRKSLLITSIILLGLAACESHHTPPVRRPRLVVGIVIDQMRWDYLYRYANRFGEGGFKRLLGQGFSCDNTMINYLPLPLLVIPVSSPAPSPPSAASLATTGSNKPLVNASTAPTTAPSWLSAPKAPPPKTARCPLATSSSLPSPTSS